MMPSIVGWNLMPDSRFSTLVQALALRVETEEKLKLLSDQDKYVEMVKEADVSAADAVTCRMLHAQLRSIQYTECAAMQVPLLNHADVNAQQSGDEAGPVCVSRSLHGANSVHHVHHHYYYYY